MGAISNPRHLKGEGFTSIFAKIRVVAIFPLAPCSDGSATLLLVGVNDGLLGRPQNLRGQVSSNPRHYRRWFCFYFCQNLGGAGGQGYFPTCSLVPTALQAVWLE